MKEIKSNQQTILYWIIMCAIFFCVIFISFYKLDTLHVEQWDEARHGINAYEMIKNKNYIVNTYLNENDYWNLKPPLSYWSIAMGYATFGFNMVGFKIYAAVSFVLLALIAAVFMNKKYSRQASICSLMFMLSLLGLTDFHMVRFADADMQLTLIYITGFICLVQSSDKKWLFPISGLMFALAFLTKSYHAITIPLCTLIYLIITRSFKDYKLKHYLGYIACAGLPILVWLAIRFTQDGFEFVTKMIFDDILKRSTTYLDASTRPIYYYVLSIGRQLIAPLLITVVAVFINYIIKRKKLEISKDIVCFVVWIIIPVIMYSLVKTKYTWYVNPQKFLLCMLLGKLYAELFENTGKIKVLATLMLILPCMGVASNIKMVYNTKPVKTEQTFLVSAIDRSEEFSEKKLYVDIEDVDCKTGYNLQHMFLVGELYGDMHGQLGGAEGFIKESEEAYLLIDRDIYKQNKELHIIPVLKENEEFLFLHK